MKRHRRDLEVMSDLNLTNMIDTAFVLLIVFILVAPAMKSGLDLQLPAVDASESTATDVNKTLIISIKKADLAGTPDHIYIDDKRVSLDDLNKGLEARKIGNPKLDVVIEADRQSTYDTFAQVVGVLKDHRIENVGLSTEPVDNANSAANKNKLKTAAGNTP